MVTANKIKTENIIKDSAPYAARLIRRVVKREKDYKSIPREVLQTARYVVDQTIGTPIQKIASSSKGVGIVVIREIIVVRPGLPAPPTVEEIPGMDPASIPAPAAALLTYPDEITDNNEKESIIEPETTLHTNYSATFEPDNSDEPGQIEEAINQLKAINHKHKDTEESAPKPKIPTQE